MRGNCRSNGPRGARFFGLVLAVVMFVVLGCGVFDALYAQSSRGAPGDDGTAVLTAPSEAPDADGSAAAAPATAPVLRFSYKAAVSGNYAIVGAEWHNGFEGMAYLYRRDGDTWIEAQKLTPTDPGRYDHFGSSVAMSGDVAVVGAPWQDLFRGAVYVFVREGDRWVEKQKLTARDGSVEGQFGRSVSVDGETLLVMGAGHDAYRFERSDGGWVEKGKAEPTTLEAVDAAAQTQLAEGIVYGADRNPAAFFGKENVTPPFPAPMVPIAPDWVKATGGSLNPLEAEVKVMWSTSVPQDAIVYKVLRDGVLVSVVSSNETQYSDKTATIGETYSYCVVVKDMNGVESAPVCDPEEGGRIIFAPIDVSATDGIYTDRVRIAWEDVSAINTGYSIRRGAVEIGTVGANTLWFDDTSAVPEVVYSYDVVATVTGGYESAAATDTSGWRGVILPPKNVSASDGQYIDRVRITWQNQAPDTMEYAIYRNGSLLGQTAANATSYVDSTVVFGVTYTYCVAAKEPETLTGIPAAGVGANGPIMTESVRVCDQGGTGLAAPGAVSASDSTYDDRVRITWKDNSNFEDGYEIFREALGDTAVIDTTRANVTLYDDLTAEPDVAYIYHVRAVNNLGGVSADSSDAGYRSIVLAPYDVAATDGTYEDHVDIVWKSTSTTAVLFKIYRDGVMIKSVSQGDRLYRDYGGTAGQTYDYEVAAVTALEVEAAGLVDQGKRDLKAPSGLAVSDETYEDKVVLSWTDNSRIEQGYLITRADASLPPDSIVEVGAYDTPGSATGVVVAGDYAYVADGDAGLRIIDISNPANPALVGSYDTPGFAYAVVVAGNYAYVADSDAGLRIIDISNPAGPTLVGSYDTPSNAVGVVAAGNHAYVANGTAGLQIIDITNPASPALEGSYDTPGYAMDVVVAGNYAYVADQEAGLQIIDITNPASPALAGSYDTPGYAPGVVVAGNYAYVADQEAGLQIIDITNPASPALFGSYDTPGEAVDVVMAGDHVYVADGTGGLQIVDISNPASPALVDSYVTPGALSVAVASDYICVADADSGLLMLRMGSEIESLPPVGPNRTSYTDYTGVPGVTYTYSVAALDSINGTVGCSAAAEDLGRRVLIAPTDVAADKGESESQVEITWRDNSDAEDGYRIYRDHVEVGTTGDNEISFVDVSPTFGQHHLYEVRAYDTYGESEAASDSGYTSLLGPTSFQASDSYEDRVELTWVDRSAIEDGFKIYRDGALIATTGPNVTAYSGVHLGFIGALDILGAPSGVAVAGNYAYVAGGASGLQVIDITTPSSPTLEGTCDTPSSAEGVDVVGSYAYVADGWGGLQIIDISTPSSPTLVGACGTTNYARGVAVVGDYAYVADQYSGLQVINISSPSSPTLVGTYNTDGEAMDVAVVGNYAYVADLDAGLQIINISAPSSPTLAGTYDTPGRAQGVAVVGSYAYVGDGGAGLLIINISTPSSPTLVGTCGAPKDARDVATFGGYAYVADGTVMPFRFQIIDISTPSSPTLVGTYDTPGPTYGVAVNGGYCYVADSYGLKIMSALSHDPYRFCVEAYNGGICSEASCDDGTIRPTEFDATITEVFPQFLASDGAAGDKFGQSVSISGNRAIVGAPYDDDKATDAGSAYIFEWNGTTWVEKHKLTASDGAIDDQFGLSVSISGDRAIVGAWNHDDKGWDAGSAYIFEWNGTTWVQKPKLTASDGALGDNFGMSVSISGDRAIVGARNDDDKGWDAGSAYIFEWNGTTWMQKPKLTASDGALGDNFGTSVSISGDRAIVGAWKSNNEEGSAYVFERDAGGTWTQKLPKLTAGDGEWNVDFGNSVSISGDRAIVGAFHDSDKGYWSGSAHIFERNGTTSTWVHKQKLTASDGDGGDCFGKDVCISGDRAIVGAYGEDGKGLEAGSAYLFERNAGSTWTQKEKFAARDGAWTDFFGICNAISGDYVIFGAPQNDDKDANSGSVYFAEFTPAPGDVAASDGTLGSRVRVTWEDRSLNEKGFRIYRDGGPIATVDANVQQYEDFDAESGRTYEYAVTALNNDVSNESERVADFGWRPANGNITGRVSTTQGAAADSVWVGYSPLPTRALLFDGSAAYVDIPDSVGAFNFGADESFTIEAWFKYQGTAGLGETDAAMIAKASPEDSAAQYPFVLGNKRSEPGRLRFAVRAGATTKSVSTSRGDLNDNAWHHVACVHDASNDSLFICVDGVVQGSASSTGLGDVTNDEPLTFGAGPLAGSWFNGQLDEVRIWNVARSASEIRMTMTEPLVGTESGLIGYWPMNACWRQDEEAVRAVTDLASGAHYGTFEGGVYWSEDCPELDIYPMTDAQGNYVLDNLYYGTNTEFEVRPFADTRQFDPAVKRVVLTTESPVENQVNFSDISSFTVSGTVRYAGTGCAVSNVSILVDNQPAGSTDTNGKFAVAVDLGEHWIQPNLEGHTFEPDSLFVNARRDTVVNDETGVAFNDSTTRTLSGRLGGGCGRPVGAITITIRSENDCLLKTLERVSGDTAYSVSLPPQNYLVSASVDPVTIPDGLSKADVVRYFQDLGVRLAEIDSADVTMDFVYRAPLQVTIRGFEDYVETCPGPLSFEDRTLPDSLPVIPQLTELPFRIEVDEDYGASGLCPLDSGTVTVYDEIFGQDPYELVIHNGAATCTTFARTPSLIIGRTDEDGNDRSFQKSISAVVDVEGRPPVTETEWVLVTGHVAPEGADFVTMTTEEMPFYILRDPPGDDSYAFLDKGFESATTIDFYESSWTGHNDGEIRDVKLGFSFDYEFGFWGFKRTQTVALQAHHQYRFTEVMTTNEDGATVVSTRWDEQFATSTGDQFVGREGDVFIGAGLNYAFSEVGVIGVDENCRVVRSRSVGVEPEGFETVFAYTEEYVSDVLIPQLESLAAYYAEPVHSKPDSVAYYQAAADNWRQTLEESDSLKVAARFEENRSFSAGADYTYAFASDTTTTHRKTVALFKDKETAWGLYANLLGFVEGEWLDVNIDQSHEVTSFEDSTQTSRSTVGYALSDDDIGDHFTVDIKQDGVYPSPVFDVRAGASSCPYEAWPDSAGAARMVPRDKPFLSIAPPEHDNVPPDEPAVFTLNLANLNQDEGRLYVLRLLTNSNPYGAVVKVGGVPLANGLEHYIDAGQSQQATLTVERGPTRYTYEDLALALYPSCMDELEVGIWEKGGALEQAYLLKFDVSFAAPCSDITLLQPQSGWVYDRADQDVSETLDLLLTDYELDIGDDGGSILDVGVEYRRLGVGPVGPGPWTVCQVVSGPNPVETLIQWLPSDSLEDGVYELRAYTHCQRGYGYSEVATGTIERNGPMVLGTPQPSDGELSLGEEISITFNELIDCRSVLADSVTLTYLDGPNTGVGIPLETGCNGTTIILTPTASASDLEGRRIEARVAGVLDKAGNPMAGAKTWAFDYRKSQFTWSELHLTADVPYRAPGALSADLVNGTSEPVEFTIAAMPSWVTSATPATGTIPPGQKQAVSFAIQDDLTGGLYEGEVTAAPEDPTQGVAVFNMHVTVSCHEPEWVVSPSDFEHTMTMVTKLSIGGGFTVDPNDKVAAFVGNQLRGVASVQEVAVGTPPYPYLAFLTVRSNRASGETVRFQVWDDSDCKLYNATDKSYPFVANSGIGTISAPDTLTATEVLAAGTLTIAVNEGWTWISTNMTTADMSVNALLSDLLPTAGDLFKSQASFSQFVDESTGWSGALVDVDNVSSYMLRLTTPGTILHNGTAADMPVPVKKGWNWIGYLPQGPVDVTDALDDLDTRTLVQAGDIVKGQDGFAEYVGGVWYGTLDVMEPGKGYKLYLGKNVDSSFEYPEYMSAPVVVAVAENAEEKTAVEGTPSWAVNPHAYQNNMTVTGVLRVGGVESIDERDLVGAFVGDECRGVAQPVYLDGLRRYEVFLMVHSNEASGERVSLRAFDADAKVVYDVTETLTFEADKVHGTVQAPIALATGAVHEEGGTAVPRVFAMEQNRPNPFNPTTTIDYDVPSGGGKVTIRIYDVGGRLVRTLLDRSETPGRKTVTWDGLSNNGQTVATGVYFYRMTAPGFEKTLKMIMMK